MDDVARGIPLPPPTPSDVAHQASPGTSRFTNPADGARAGDLTTPWRVLVGLAWIASFFAYAAIYQASVQIGISTWWIGPRATPNTVPIRVLPFLLSLGVALLAIYNVRRLTMLSIIGSLAAALIALPDLDRSTGLAIAEFIVAALLMVISLASLTGRYRMRSAAGFDAPTSAPIAMTPGTDAPS